MLTGSRYMLCLALLLATFLQLSMGFAPMMSPSLLQRHHHQALPTTTTTTTTFLVDPLSSSSSMQLSAGTLDPTTVLSDVLGAFLGTPAILLVPIVAALSVASLIAFFIVSYANPEVEDDEK